MMMDMSKIYMSNNCGEFKVISYVNYRTVEVEFIKTKYKTKVSKQYVLKGIIKDRLHPSVLGVGYIGVGNYKSMVKGRVNKSYSIWSAMINRCYGESYKKRCPTYVGCTVASEWHDYQAFCKWFYLNYTDGLHLDKDILVDGNKVYSPENCKFVNLCENAIKAHAKNYSFINPDGDIVNIYNLANFCRKKKLNKSEMYKVNDGIIDSHKEWTKAPRINEVI